MSTSLNFKIPYSTICHSKPSISVSLRMGHYFSHVFGSHSNSNSSPFPRVLARVNILNLGRVLPKSLNSPFSILIYLPFWSSTLRIQSYVYSSGSQIEFYGNQTLIWDLSCKLFNKVYPCDQYLWKRGEGVRSKQKFIYNASSATDSTKSARAKMAHQRWPCIGKKWPAFIQLPQSRNGGGPTREGY